MRIEVKESGGRRVGAQIELEQGQNFEFHFSHGICCISRINLLFEHIKEIVKLGRINLLRFRSYQHCGESEKLELSAGNIFACQIPINNIDCNEEGFGL